MPFPPEVSNVCYIRSSKDRYAINRSIFSHTCAYEGHNGDTYYHDLVTQEFFNKNIVPLLDENITKEQMIRLFNNKLLDACIAFECVAFFNYQYIEVLAHVIYEMLEHADPELLNHSKVKSVAESVSVLLTGYF